MFRGKTWGDRRALSAGEHSFSACSACREDGDHRPVQADQTQRSRGSPVHWGSCREQRESRFRARAADFPHSQHMGKPHRGNHMVEIMRGRASALTARGHGPDGSGPRWTGLTHQVRFLGLCREHNQAAQPRHRALGNHAVLTAWQTVWHERRLHPPSRADTDARRNDRKKTTCQTGMRESDR